MNKLTSTYYRVFQSLVGPSETENLNFFTIGWQLESTEIWQFLLFFINTANTFRCNAKKD